MAAESSVPQAPLLAERRGAVLVLTMNRPDARNALNVATRQAIIAAAEQADADESVAAVVLTGTDPAFSAGVDLKEALSPNAPRGVRGLNPAATLRAMTKPVIAAVNGVCVTGALEVMLSCSFAVASEHARFGDTHAKVGLTPGWGGSVLLPRAVGVAWARRLSGTGEVVGAETGLRIGLVTEVVPHERLLSRAVELATAISKVDSAALAATYRMYERGDGIPAADAFALEREIGRERRLDPKDMTRRFSAAAGGST